MNNAEIYCLCLHDHLLEKVKSLNYIPVGLGKNEFSPGWLKDNTGKNITEKNQFYGEYSFHYWLWKNKLEYIDPDIWIGFCAYRRFWGNNQNIKSSNISKNFLKEIPEEWDDYDVILGDDIHLDTIKWMKVLKYGKLAFLKYPKAIFKSKRNIKFQFDLFHGVGILDKAISLLDQENKKDFNDYVNKNTSYNQGNMFITKSKTLMKEYYNTIFKWLADCEKVFGYDLKEYNKVRLYAFLAERFLPYWFNKNAKVLKWPIIFHDLNKN